MSAARWLTMGLILAFAAVTVAPAEARPRGRERPAHADRTAQRGPGAGPGAKDKRERVKQRIRAMRALILSEELELDEATAGKLAPILNRFDDEMTRLLTERAQLRAELRTALDAGDDKRLGQTTDRLVANQDARWDTERKRFADLRRLLSPRQAARLLDVLPEIDRRIMKGLRDRGRPPL